MLVSGTNFERSAYFSLVFPLKFQLSSALGQKYYQAPIDRSGAALDPQKLTVCRLLEVNSEQLVLFVET